MTELVVKAENLKKYFPIKMGFLRSILGRDELFVRAVDDISFDIRKGEIFGLAGESGSGKTTTGRLVLRLIEPTGGKVHFQGTDITELEEGEMKPLRRHMQIVFQDEHQ